MTKLPRSCPPDSLLEADLGLPVVKSRGAGTAACVYTGVRAIVSINFALTPGLTAAQAEARIKAQDRTAAFRSVPGVGDAAFYDAPTTKSRHGSYIAVLSGPVSFHIVTNAAIPVGRMAAAAEDIIKDQ